MKGFFKAALALLLMGSSGCIVGGGAERALPPDPHRAAPDSQWQPAYWYISHHYGAALADAYLNQPQTTWHRDETFEENFLFTALSLDPEGRRCLSFLETSALPEGGVGFDCLLLKRNAQEPSWTATRDINGARVFIVEYVDAPEEADEPARTVSYYTGIDGRILRIDQFAVTSRSTRWQRTQTQPVTELLAKDAALRQTEIQRYRQTILERPLPEEIARFLSDERGAK